MSLRGSSQRKFGGGKRDHDKSMAQYVRVVRTLGLPRDFQLTTTTGTDRVKVPTGRPFGVRDRACEAVGAHFRFVWRGVVRSMGVLIGALHRARARALARHCALVSDRGDGTASGSRHGPFSSSSSAYFGSRCVYWVRSSAPPRGEIYVGGGHDCSRNRRGCTLDDDFVCPKSKHTFRCRNGQHAPFQMLRLRCAFQRTEWTNACRHSKVCAVGAHLWRWVPTEDLPNWAKDLAIIRIISSGLFLCTRCDLVHRASVSGARGEHWKKVPVSGGAGGSRTLVEYHIDRRR